MTAEDRFVSPHPVCCLCNVFESMLRCPGPFPHQHPKFIGTCDVIDFLLEAEKDRKDNHVPEAENTTHTSSNEPNRAESEQAEVTPFTPSTEAQILAGFINKSVPQYVPIIIIDYDPEWPQLYQREARRIRSALEKRVLLLEHVGSTSVPGLAAKPRIDMLLVVENTADEPSYVPDLQAVGYILTIREPDWFEHRLFKGPDTDINLHVFSSGCAEIDRMLLFRDWLRTNGSDRLLYERTKRELASNNWKYVQNYADAKTSVVNEILARAQKSSKPLSQE